MARIKGKDLYLKNDDQIYFGDNQEVAVWYDDDGEFHVDHTISGVAAVEDYHLVIKSQLYDTIVELVDTPGYYEDGSLLQSTTSGIEWTTISGINTDTFIELTDTPTSYSVVDYTDPKYVRIKSDGSGLEFAPAIVGTTSTGTTPPEDSNLWYYPPHNTFYAKNLDNGKWQSIMVHGYLFSYGGNIDGLYLSVGNVVASYAHHLMPRAGTITGIMANAEPLAGKTDPAKVFEVYDDLNLLATFSLSNWEYYNLNVDIDVNEGAKLKVFCVLEGKRVRNPIVTLEIKWRYVIP